MSTRAPEDPTPRCDLLVTGGHLLLRGGVVEQDLLVLDGRIAAVGAEARERAGPATPWLDAAGGLVSPGFGDAHVHPHHAGLQLLGCDLGGSADAGRYLRVIAEHAAAHPALDAASRWVTGGGWSMEAFPGGVPTAAALDAVLPDRPAFLPNRDGHGAWVNTAALRAAGIDADTPDPPDGRIERDGRGEPVGTLQEGAAALVAAHVPLPGDAVMDAALLAAQERLLAWGVTSWQDAMVGATGSCADPLPSYLRLAASGRLRASVVGALWWERSRGLEQVEDLLERRRRGSAGRFRATSVKIMQDGVAENFTAAMLEPYLDACGCPAGDGHSFLEPADLARAVAALHAADVQVHLHTLGDRAVREALDAVEAAQRAAPGRDLRHHLAHLQVVHPDDVPRFAALGVSANVQPLWAVHERQMDELTIPFLGERRAGWQYPFADLAAAGAVLATGSDWPVTTADVMACLHVAVNRSTDPAREPFLPHQALTLAQALAAATAGVAHVNHDEARSGSLDTGKDGDLTVLDRDPFDHPDDEIGAARVLATVIAGDVVHDAGAAGAASTGRAR